MNRNNEGITPKTRKKPNVPKVARLPCNTTTIESYNYTLLDQAVYPTLFTPGVSDMLMPFEDPHRAEEHLLEINGGTGANGRNRNPLS